MALPMSSCLLGKIIFYHREKIADMQESKRFFHVWDFSAVPDSDELWKTDHEFLTDCSSILSLHDPFWRIGRVVGPTWEQSPSTGTCPFQAGASHTQYLIRTVVQSCSLLLQHRESISERPACQIGWCLCYNHDTVRPHPSLRP